MTERKSCYRHSFIKWIASIVFIFSCFMPILSKTAFAEEIFSDVHPSNSHYPGIIEAYENGFLSGYQDGTFKPNLKLSRANVVKSLGKLVLIQNGKSLNDINFSKTPAFNDVPPTHSDRELYEYSIVVKEAGIFTGSNNNLLPYNFITRQQMAKVLVNAFDLQSVPGKTSKVKDLHLAGNEYRPYINILSENEVTTVTNFRPGETTTRAQFATFLTNANKASKKQDEQIKPDPPVGNEDTEPPADNEGQVEIIPPEKGKEPELPEIPVAAATPLLVEELLPRKVSDIILEKTPKQVPVVYTDGKIVPHDVV